MIPVRRDLDFELPHQLQPQDLLAWHRRGPMVTHFFNALSTLFPEGERFFIQSVRHYRDRIDDPVLKQQIAGFIGQEAMHGREHVGYNALLDRAGLPAAELDRRVGGLLARVRALVSPAFQLAATLALEHFTAMLAHLLLTDPRTLGRSDARLSAMGRWHALEETEHKGVAFDAYVHVFGSGPASWARRCFVMLVASVIFLNRVFVFHLRMIEADPAARGARNWLRLADFLYGRPGVLRWLALPWLDYFRPRFHPWDHDNRELLSEIAPISGRFASVRR